MEKNVFWSSLGFTKVRVPVEKRPEENFQYNILDQTRVHFRHYNLVLKLAASMADSSNSLDNNMYQLKQVEELIFHPAKLQEFKRENMDRIEDKTRSTVINMIIDDLTHPFKDPREDSTLVRTIDKQRFEN
jgi:transcriptional accessory protein Tex/SPT6